ncbi:hypothetical protein PR202_ga27728 [Eleusine coracana subsp. coracana]|uniref:Serine-threonine/tyrosine-protein kinase catalytic domain-containing protein n=1 Tax=Eleusine coracana subsp. coracana TaxID=191504 RepID=A0AAV5DHF3_ELECO|nr:hypothetical protein PR202_ga27728 [Eleusine coracana subsp. coracana]
MGSHPCRWGARWRECAAEGDLLCQIHRKEGRKDQVIRKERLERQCAETVEVEEDMLEGSCFLAASLTHDGKICNHFARSHTDRSWTARDNNWNQKNNVSRITRSNNLVSPGFAFNTYRNCKGTLKTGEHIAVKRLSKHLSQGFHELKNELVLAAKLKHKNLAPLIGVCLQQEKLLVYEYMPNSSLDTFLFGSP